MDALISIPDLDDDTIYPVESQQAQSDAYVQQTQRGRANDAAAAAKPRPFRGAELEHTRSNSIASIGSSTGSRAGGGTGGSSVGVTSNNFFGKVGSTTGSAVNGGGHWASSTASTSNSSVPTAGFPRKSSFASLKAAFKAPTAPQDAYPAQLRDPFSSDVHASSSFNGSAGKGGDAQRGIHGRDDSFVSTSTSRSKFAHPSIGQRHAQQSSIFSQNSQSNSLSNADSSSIVGQTFRPGQILPPPMPPLPEAYNGTNANPLRQQGSSLPPSRTAYARSMSNQVMQNVPNTLAYDDDDRAATHKVSGFHERNESIPSSFDNHSASGEVVQTMGMADTYNGALDEQLRPPQPAFASSWHTRGMSNGSRDTSEDGVLPPLDVTKATTDTMSRNFSSQDSSGAAGRRSERGQMRNELLLGDNSSIASLPIGVGLEDPISPAEYAINVLFSRFITLAGVRIRTAIGGVDEVDPSLERVLGPGTDGALDTLLASLAHVSRKSPAAIVSSLFRWRETMLEDRIDVGEVRGALSGSQSGLSMGVRDVANILMRRKTLATAYLLSRALIEVGDIFSAGPSEGSIKGMTEKQVNDLHVKSFNLLRECSRENCSASRTQGDAFENAARLVGVLSKTCFAAIGERINNFLEQRNKIIVTAKDADPAVEAIVAAIRYLHITSFPMELFEEGADFLDVASKGFTGAHGQRLKSTYAESLTLLLLPVAKSASAELHHPTWVKALSSIAPRAFAMISKPRYWSVAYSLYVSVLCVSPEERFLQSSQEWSWVQCLEAGIAKLSKDRTLRPVVQNAAIFLLWTYLFRCRESSSTTAKRLDWFFKFWFPINRQHIFPQDSASLESHIYMTHFVLYRQFDFGRDFVLDLLRAQSLSGNTVSMQPELLSKQRMTIAIRAILLTLDAHVKGCSPPFPAELVLRSEVSDLGDQLPESFTFPTNEIGTAQSHFNDLIGKIALLCDQQIGSLSIFDDQVMLVRGTSISNATATLKNASDEEKLCWRQHAQNRFITAYSKESQPYMDLLRACFDSWPRCLSVNVPFANVLAILQRAYFSADPQLADAATRCLTRIAEQRKGGATQVASSFMRWLLRMDAVYWETHPNQHIVLSKVDQAVRLLISFLEIWHGELRKGQVASTDERKRWEMERTSAWALIDEVEAIGLFLLCSAWRPLRRHAIGVLRIVAKLDDVFAGKLAAKALADGDVETSEHEKEPSRVIDLLDWPCSRFMQTSEDPSSELATEISAWQKARSRKWQRTPSSKDTLADLAESDRSAELSTWYAVVPQFLRTCLEHFPTTIAVFRSLVTNRISAMESAISNAAGTSNRAATATATATATSTMRGQMVGAGSLMAFSLGGGSNANATSGVISGVGNRASSVDQNLMGEHWKLYILALCTTTTSIEGSASRVKSNEVPTAERVVAAKDLFQKLVPYLASDQAQFREAVVTALGNINVNLYKTLLETLQTVNAQLSDDFRRNNSKRNKVHERLRTALAHVIQLTSPHMTSEGSFMDAGITNLILQWIKETFAFLTDRDVRLDWELHGLRRYFAGVAEQFFDALYASKKPGDDAFQHALASEARLRMFRLFRDWHSFSQAAKDGPAKLANLLSGVAEQYREDRNRETVLTALRIEMQLLSFHASKAMAALCQGAITLTERNQTMPLKSSSLLDSTSLTEWLKHLFLSPSPQNHAVARKALRALLMHNERNIDLVLLVLNHSYSESEQTTANRSFFVVFADVVVEKGLEKPLPLTLSHLLCLGLVKLGHVDIDSRKKAFLMLISLDPNPPESNVSLLLHSLEGGVSSPLPATYLRAQRDVSTFLADRFQDHKVDMLCEYTFRLPGIDLSRRATTLGLLPEWLHRLDLADAAGQTTSGSTLSRRAMLILSNLLAMTIRYGDNHNFEVQDMWASLAEGENYAGNATVLVKFLIQQALVLRSSVFIMHAKRAVSCLSHTVLASALLTEMCSYIEPSSMIPVPLDQSGLITSHPQFDHLFLADLETLLPPPSRRQTFSPGQIALLFVGELMYDTTAILLDKLPLLLHAIFMHVDSMSAFTQEQVMTMFEQLMRSLTVDSSTSSVAQVDKLFSRGTNIFWTQGDSDFDAMNTPRIMRATVLETSALVRPMLKDVNDRWGNVALYWATSNPVRHMACRSFQMYRVLLPDVNYSMLADMLGRLSNTISDSIRIDNQSFALEILYTIKAIVKRDKQDKQSSLLGHIFWMNVACLSTVNETEFVQAVDLMYILLDRLDLDDADTVKMLKAQCPDGWEGDTGGLQNLVIRGLKSASVYKDSLRLLARLSKIVNGQLIDRGDSRVGSLFMVTLPWFLEATDSPGTVDEAMITTLAEDIARLAAEEGKVDIERVASSIAKKRFRTKDDLLRQAVNACVRSGFLPHHASDVALMLLGLIFNAEIWLRKQTLQTLKMFFQSVDTRRQDFSELGPELLMPLLRLLSTDLSMQVLEVMEEKILTSMQTVDSSARRGPNAQQIVRMSLQWHNLPLATTHTFSGNYPSSSSRAQAPNFMAIGSRTPAAAAHTARRKPDLSGSNGGQESNSLFGMPDESGWSVADIPEWTSRTRINILSVFKSVEMLLDTPPVGEVNFVDEYDPEGDNIFELNMTASRSGVDDMESASMQQARSGTTSNRAATNTAMMAESQSSTSRSFVEEEGDETTRDQSDERANVGDIINQLHDLSSFFIDDDSVSVAGGGQSVSGRDPRMLLSRRSRTSRKSDDPVADTFARRPLLWGGGGNARQTTTTTNGGRYNEANEENGEQIAKILGRSALASMMGRTAGVMNGVTRSHSSSDQLDDRLATPTPNADSFPRTPTGVIASSSGGGLSDTIDDRSTTSSNNNVASKRGSMWVRKSLFGRRPNLPVRSASETIGGEVSGEYEARPSSSPPPLPISSSVPTFGAGDQASTTESQDGDV